MDHPPPAKKVRWDRLLLLLLLVVGAGAAIYMLAIKK
jgi:hypothetical protein